MTEPLMAWEPLMAISINGEPRPAPRYQRTKTGREFMPNWYMQHKRDLGKILRGERGTWRPDKTSTFYVKVLCYRSTRHAVDVDNLAKTILDAGQHAIWENDSQVERFSITKLLDREHPRTEIRVWVKQAQAVLAL